MTELERCIVRDLQKLNQFLNLNESKDITQMVMEGNILFDINIQRLVIVGGLFINHFPKLLKLNPKQTELENQKIFAPVEKFFKHLAEEYYIPQVNDEVFNDV